MQQRQQKGIDKFQSDQPCNAPGSRCPQTDVVVNAALSPGVVPPPSVIESFQQVAGHPLHKAAHNRRAQEQKDPPIPQFLQSDGHRQSGETIDAAQGAAQDPPVDKLLPPHCRRHHFKDPSGKGIGKKQA